MPLELADDRGIADRRADFLHKVTTRLVRENQALAIEDLTVRNMVRNRSLARAISDASWSEFRRMLEYKAGWHGREVMLVDRWFPSSKLCSAQGCGHVAGKMPLNVRSWTCPSCGTVHDRDVNAAKNILAAGRAAARNTLGDACGADVSHSGSSRVRSAVKQEPRRATAGIPVLQGGE